jgi:hypothetical protein
VDIKDQEVTSPYMKTMEEWPEGQGQTICDEPSETCWAKIRGHVPWLIVRDSSPYVACGRHAHPCSNMLYEYKWVVEEYA